MPEQPSGLSEEIAFLISLGAGLCTSISSIILFFPHLTHPRLAKNMIAGGLALASGVMLYSFGYFLDANHDPGAAYGYVLLSFMLGVLVYELVEVAVTYMYRGKKHQEDVLLEYLEEEEASCTLYPHSPESTETRGEETNAEIRGVTTVKSTEKIDDDETSKDKPHGVPHSLKSLERNNLDEIGIVAAIVIGVQNFPEGIATFIASLSSKSVGIFLAVAIAIHNIPEGLCVGLPVYYSSGSKFKAFMYTFISGMFQPLGAGLCWIVVSGRFNENIFGALYGFVVGLMTIIVMQCIYPTSMSYDPVGKVRIPCLIFSFFIMAFSIMLFQFSDF